MLLRIKNKANSELHKKEREKPEEDCNILKMEFHSAIISHLEIKNNITVDNISLEMHFKKKALCQKYLKKSDDICTWEFIGRKSCFVEHNQEHCKTAHAKEIIFPSLLYAIPSISLSTLRFPIVQISFPISI